MFNKDIREAAKRNGVFLYAVAEKLGVSEPTMTRMLRKELGPEKKSDIFKIISELSQEQISKA